MDLFNRKKKNMSNNTEQPTTGNENATGTENPNDTLNMTEQPAAEENTPPDAPGNDGSADEKAAERDIEAELKAKDDKYLRLYAEFENFRRRTATERIELFKTAGQEVLGSMLPVMDDFERALKAMESIDGSDPLRQGVELVYHKLKNTLVAQGLKPMESVGKEFDSEFHEAITKIPAPSEDMKGKVVDEAEKGYFLNDKVIRFAKVIVGE
jgi:molecular chaperone GrpE